MGYGRSSTLLQAVNMNMVLKVISIQHDHVLLLS